MTVFSVFSEFECDIIRELTCADRVTAKQQGIRLGRPKKRMKNKSF